MKFVILVLLVIFLALQYRLWVGEGSVAHQVELGKKIDQQQQENDILKERNRLMAIEVEALKNGTEAIEERAREELGMIKDGETFFMIVEPDASSENQ